MLRIFFAESFQFLYTLIKNRETKSFYWFKVPEIATAIISSPNRRFFLNFY